VGPFSTRRYALRTRPVEERGGEGGVAELRVPGVDGQLAGADGRASAGAIFQHFKQVAPLRLRWRNHQKIIQDQKVVAGDAGQGLGIAAVGVRDGSLLQ